MAKKFYRVEVKDGRKTYFWYESWNSLGCLADILEGRGYIDLGIPINAVVSASRSHRKRYHMITILNRIEMEIERYKSSIVEEENISLWRNGGGKFKKTFISNETWQVLRERHQECHWGKAVWFRYATPKYSFILWIAIKETLSTGDRMQSWNGNIDPSCLCYVKILWRQEDIFSLSVLIPRKFGML